MVIAAFLALASLTSSHDAHRIGIERLPLTGPATEIGACAMRALGRMGNPNQVLLPDGVSIDWRVGKTFIIIGADGPAFMTFEFHQDQQGPFMRVLYRHPMSTAAAIRTARTVSKGCFPNDWNKWAETSGAKPVKQ